MGPVEAPLRCLAVHVGFAPTGEIDCLELEACLDELAGRGQWLSSTDWMFAEPPAEVGGWATVPVAIPEAIAALAIRVDAANDPPRILHDYVPSPVEVQKWLAFRDAPNSQGQGRFPCEGLNA